MPDSPGIRKRLAGRYAAGSEDTFDLLAAIGRDCVGAIQLLTDNETPKGIQRIDGEPLNDEEVAAWLRATVTGGAIHGPHNHSDFRISIAGAQEKTALLHHADQWMRPLGATPTTHILKLPLGLVGNMQADMRTSVYNEWLCLKLMDALGFQVAHADIVKFADHPPVLVVERFDRKLHTSGQWLVRLLQEDFCQVLGVSPHPDTEFGRYALGSATERGTLNKEWVLPDLLVLKASENLECSVETQLQHMASDTALIKSFFRHPSVSYISDLSVRLHGVGAIYDD